MNTLDDSNLPAALAASGDEEIFHLLGAVCDDGLWRWDVAGGTVAYSGRWYELMGLPPQEGDDEIDTWLDRVHPRDRPRVRFQLDSFLRGDAPLFESEFRLDEERGRGRSMISRAKALPGGHGAAPVVVGSLISRSEQAIYDDLTGLPNRTLLRERLQHALEHLRRGSGPEFAVLFLDLNSFKVINDSLGHQVGDRLLVEVAKRLQLCVRGGDTVARLGGDEFVVLLEGVESEEVLLSVISRVERYTASTFELGDYQVVSSTSMGVVKEVRDYTSIDDILRDADIAMYHAKQRRLPFAFFDARMYERATARQKLEIEIRQGLERGEFFLQYQPIISLHDGSIQGYEALARWNHPTHGLIGPDTFIPICEETGLIVPLGEWVLLEACRQVRVWLRDGADGDDLTVSVNLSSKQLILTDFVPVVADALRDTGVDPRHLRLEVTESVVMEDTDQARQALTGLKHLGVSISIDDFGTGYSSLSYIHSLPLDALKIDRSFIARLLNDPTSREIVRTFVSLARSLGLDSISEGVENAEQADILRDLGCTHAQGFHYSRPR